MDPYEIKYDESTKKFTLYQNLYTENKLTFSEESVATTSELKVMSSKITHRQLINLLANLFNESSNEKISFHKISYIFRLLGKKLKSEGLVPTLDNIICLLENNYKNETGVKEITPDMGKFFKINCKLNQLNLYETFKNLHDNIKEQIPNCPKQKINLPEVASIRNNTLFKNRASTIKPAMSKRDNKVQELTQVISAQLQNPKGVTIENTNTNTNTNTEDDPLITNTEKEESPRANRKCCCFN